MGLPCPHCSSGGGRSSLKRASCTGRDLADDQREESHPVVTSRFDMHALRRTPPSEAAPDNEALPVLTVLYAICRTDSGVEAAVVLLGGDKTALANQWSPTAHVTEAEFRLEPYCRQQADLSPVSKRGGR